MQSLEARALRHRRLERIEADHQEIDRLDVVRHHRAGMLGIVADRQQAAMHLRMQRLDAPVHHLGEAGEIRDVDHREAGVGDRLGGAAGGDDLDAEPTARWRISIRPVLSDTEISARSTRRGEADIIVTWRNAAPPLIPAKAGIGDDLSGSPLSRGRAG